MTGDAENPFAPGGAVRVTGHRGAAGAAPENTIPSLLHARRAAVDAVEFDLHCSRDGTPVLLHDPTLDRTTDGSGSVEELDIDELRRLDAGHRFTPDRGVSFPYRGRGVRIPTLDEAVEAVQDLPLVIEVKSERAGEALERWLRGPGTAEADRVMVGGFSGAAVEEPARRARWRCATADQLRPYVLLGKVGLAGLAVPTADALMVPTRRGIVPVATGRFIRGAHRDGLGVHVWTVNRPSRMRRLLDLGADGILTDFPSRARRILEERAAREDVPSRDLSDGTGVTGETDPGGGADGAGPIPTRPAS